MLIIIAALKLEVTGFLKNMDIKTSIRAGNMTIFHGSLAGIHALIILTGMGKAGALSAVKLLEDFMSKKPADTDNDKLKKLAGFIGPERMIKDTALVVTGLCGATTGELGVGDTVCYRKIRNMKEESGFQNIDPLPPDNGTMPGNRSFPYGDILKNLQVRQVTCCNVEKITCSIEEKEDIIATSGAEVIDMESYWLAERLGALNIPLIFIKVVSDNTSGSLPDYFENLTDAVPLLSLIKYALFSIFRKKTRECLIAAIRNLKIAGKKLTEVQNKVVLNLIAHTGDF